MDSKKRLKRGAKVNKKAPTEIKRSRVLNDDLLVLIFKYLSIREKLQQERVSRQFGECIRQCLQTQKGLTFGPMRKKCLDVNHSSFNGNIKDSLMDSVKENFYKLLAHRNRLEPIFRKCKNTKSLCLRWCRIDAQTINWIVVHLPQLNCLRLENNIRCDWSHTQWQQIGDCIGSQLIHLSLDALNVRNDCVAHLIKRLPHLQELTLLHYRQPLDELLSSLGSHIKTLAFINCASIDTQAFIEFFCGTGKDIISLTINHCNNNIDANIIELIASHLIHLRHFSLSIKYHDESWLFATSLSNLNKLQNLQTLTLDLEAFINFTALQFNRLDSLCLVDCFLSPQMLLNFDEKMPQLKKLSLQNCRFCCECNQVNNNATDCFHCFQECCQSLSKLYSLTALSFSCKANFTSNNPLFVCLPSFSKLHTLSFSCLKRESVVELIKSCIQLATINNKRLIRLKIAFNKRFISYFKDKIPKNLQILNFTDTL